jgi:hypothetical protein
MPAQDGVPGFGLPADAGKLQWCSGWAKGHAEAVDIGRKKCDGCGDKVLSFGLPTEGKTRWCGGCVKKCGGCQLKLPSFWTAGGGEKVKARWCGGCVKARAGAVTVGRKKCGGWLLQLPSFGLPAEGKR